MHCIQFECISYLCAEDDDDQFDEFVGYMSVRKTTGRLKFDKRKSFIWRACVCVFQYEAGYETLKST